MKYLLQAIETSREAVRLSDPELRKLLVEVRSGKDDRIEFIESMTRLVDELRSSDHAAAFLTKVAKRDAPDYYDVIKNPMDLGTMVRNVKSGRYKSKAQFMRDLDLIWDNCLTYNSEPTHPLRRSVQLMRQKANHLLTYVNDTNDVKEALNQWQATSTSAGAGPSNGTSEAPLSAGLSWADAPLHGLNGVSNGSSMSNGHMSLKRVNAALADAPFEQRPAVLRTVEGMSTFDMLDNLLSRADERFEQRYMTRPGASKEAGPSRQTIPCLDMNSGLADSATAGTSGDLLRSLETGNYGGLLRSALTMGTNTEDERGEAGSSSTATVQASGSSASDPTPEGSPVKAGRRIRSRRVPYPLDKQPSYEGFVGDPYQLGAWWNATPHPSILASGLTPLGTSVQLDPRPKRAIGQGSLKRKAKRQGRQWSFGGVDALERNVSTITKLRKTHANFGTLNSHIENEEPIPAALAVVSSDESDEEREQGGEEGKRPRRRHREVNVSAPGMHDPSRNPFAKLSSESATEVVQNKTQFLLAHAGFEGTQRSAASVLTDVASEYIMNLGRTLRMYTDKFAREMSVEEIILHGLYENGAMDVRGLESYVVDDVMRYGSKMSDLLRKLQSSYRETLSNANVTMEDEAYFAENAEGNNDQIMSGGYAQDMGDDFFGFKEMGLDKELGIDMSRLVVPSKLFNRTAGPSGSRNAVGGAAAANGMANVRGAPLQGSANGGGARGGGMGGNEVVMFEPPPPYVPLTEAAIAAQIGLLQPFYRELFRARGQWQQRNKRRRAKTDEGKEEADAEADDEDGGQEEEGEGEEEQEGEGEGGQGKVMVLPDEEMERQRYKVPPNGKMPKRAMKMRSEGERIRAVATTTSTAASASASTAGDKAKAGGSTSGQSNKKKKKNLSQA